MLGRPTLFVFRQEMAPFPRCMSIRPGPGQLRPGDERIHPNLRGYSEQLEGRNRRAWEIFVGKGNLRSYLRTCK